MKDLTQGSIVRNILAMAAPLAAGMIFQTLYFLVDLYFVAGLGDASVAGVGAAGTLMFGIMALTQVLGVGAVVREAVKPETANAAPVAPFGRQRVLARVRRQGKEERRIEHGIGGHARIAQSGRAHDSQCRRVVQRRELAQRVELTCDVARDPHRRCELRAAVHDAMPDRDQPIRRGGGARQQPIEQHFRGARVIADGTDRHSDVVDA